jgi:hypothetical protein
MLHQSARGAGTPRAFPAGVKAEMKFLKYRRDVVSAWPESPRKTVFLTAIESRIQSMERLARLASSTTPRQAAAA